MTRKNVFLLISIIIVSVLGGVAGGILVRSYFLNASFNVPLFGDINVGGEYRDGSLVISQPKKVVVEQNDRIAAVAADAQKSLVDFYKKKTAPAADSAKTNDTPRSTLVGYYTPSERLGRGLVVTSDGWILTSVNVTKTGAAIALGPDGTLLAVEKTTAATPSGYYFVKVDAANLVAAQFSEQNSVSDGQSILGLTDDGIAVTHVRQARHDTGGAAVLSTESAYNVITVDNETMPAGTVMLGLDGTVAGVYEGKGVVVPMYQYGWLLPGLLSDGAIKRPYFGVHYLNLYTFIGAEKLKGALISKDARGVAVAKNSPAAAAGLLENDIITAVDGRAVTAENTLSSLILSRRPGDEIELTVTRAGEEQTVKAVLSSLE